MAVADSGGAIYDPAGFDVLIAANVLRSRLDGDYTTISAEMDDLLFIYDIAIAQSQSNAGNRSSRPQAWAKNVGWRIDYQVVTPGVGKRVQAARIYKDKRFSDHAPLIIDYDYTL